MEVIQNAAFVSVGRACGFTGLAVFCIMLGLAFDPALSARSGGLLCLGLAAYLSFCAWRARERNYKRTETWLILPKDERPPASVAQKVIGEALRETYLWFAKNAALLAAILLAASVVLQLAGVRHSFAEGPPGSAAGVVGVSFSSKPRVMHP
ncbi:MAG: hypothetical protein AAF441_08925 [Pseudomonadota bacterium]